MSATYHFYPGSIDGLVTKVQIVCDSYREAVQFVEEFIHRGANYVPHCRIHVSVTSRPMTTVYTNVK